LHQPMVGIAMQLLVGSTAMQLPLMVTVIRAHMVVDMVMQVSRVGWQQTPIG